MILQYLRLFYLGSILELISYTQENSFLKGLNSRIEICGIHLKKQFQVPTVTLTKPLINNQLIHLFLVYFGC